MSGRSAACAPDTAPQIIAVSTERNRRITTLQSNLGVDHRLLTLTNRCAASFPPNKNGAGGSAPGQAEALTQKAVEMALGGDTVALKLCLERIYPACKPHG